jgi:hypothetical protein
MLNSTFACVGLLSAALVSTSAFATPRDEFRILNSEGGISQQRFPGPAGSTSREGVKGEFRAWRDGSTRLTEASPGPTPSAGRAAFSSTRDEARQAASVLQQSRPSDGWRDLGGDAGWVFDGR